MKKRENIDMLHGPLAGKLILFALPLACSSILQQLFNSADLAVVGRFAGSQALAAVGANGANVGIFVNLLIGAAAGPNVLVANLIGQGKKQEVSEAVHTIIAFAILGGLLLMLTGLGISHFLMTVTGTPEDVIGMAELYLRIYLCGIPFITLYNFGAAILRSVGDTRRPLLCMILSGFTNVGLNLIFVVILKMSVAGVALATALSNVLSAGLVVGFLIREKGMIHLDLRRLKIQKEYLIRVLQIGLPAGIQSMVFSVSNIFVQKGINEFGAMAMAGASAGLNFEYFTYAFSVAFAQATMTFASQNYGAGNHERCKKVFWLTLLEGFCFSEALSLIFGFGANTFVRIYTTDAAVISFALIRIHHVVALEGLTAMYEVPAAAIRSRGYSMLPAILSIIGTVVFRIFWVYIVFARAHSFEMLMNVYPASWIFTSGMLFVTWFLILRRSES